MLAIEANDEWLVGRAYISQKSMASVTELLDHLPESEEEELTERSRPDGRNRTTDEHEHQLLHHAPGLD